MADMGEHLEAAAKIIADQARTYAAAWSVQIPASITTDVSGGSAVISSGVGPAYPNEVPGVIHPVFGPTLRNPRPAHVLNKYRPFLAPAYDAGIDAAVDEIARYVDDVCHDDGFVQE